MSGGLHDAGVERIAWAVRGLRQLTRSRTGNPCDDRDKQLGARCSLIRTRNRSQRYLVCQSDVRYFAVAYAQSVPVPAGIPMSCRARQQVPCAPWRAPRDPLPRRAAHSTACPCSREVSPLRIEAHCLARCGKSSRRKTLTLRLMSCARANRSLAAPWRAPRDPHPCWAAHSTARPCSREVSPLRIKAHCLARCGKSSPRKTLKLLLTDSLWPAEAHVGSPCEQPQHAAPLPAGDVAHHGHASREVGLRIPAAGEPPPGSMSHPAAPPRMPPQGLPAHKRVPDRWRAPASRQPVGSSVERKRRQRCHE